LLIGGINYFTWCVGSLAGALAGEAMTFDTTGMDFALTALFAVLLVEQIRQVRAAFPFLMVLACGVVVLAVFGGSNMLLISIALAIVLLLGDGARRGWR
jgi:4-azaleucine resistance transporter AzlC